MAEDIPRLVPISTWPSPNSNRTGWYAAGASVDNAPYPNSFFFWGGLRFLYTLPPDPPNWVDRWIEYVNVPYFTYPPETAPHCIISPELSNAWTTVWISNTIETVRMKLTVEDSIWIAPRCQTKPTIELFSQGRFCKIEQLAPIRFKGLFGGKRNVPRRASQPIWDGTKYTWEGRNVETTNMWDDPDLPPADPTELRITTNDTSLANDLLRLFDARLRAMEMIFADAGENVPSAEVMSEITADTADSVQVFHV